VSLRSSCAYAWRGSLGQTERVKGKALVIVLTSIVLLFILTPAMLIPFFDRIHSTMLFWLAPSQQIRPPIYSFRQRSQRRKIVFKCESSI
jgi:1,3-beta-glucan synthase